MPFFALFSAGSTADAGESKAQIESICRVANSLKSVPSECSYFYSTMNKAQASVQSISNEIAASRRQADLLLASEPSCVMLDQLARISQAFGREQDEMRGQRNLLNPGEIENYLSDGFSKLPEGVQKKRVQEMLTAISVKMRSLSQSLEPKLMELLAQINKSGEQVVRARRAIGDSLNCAHAAPALPLRVSLSLTEDPLQGPIQLTALERLLQFSVFKFVVPGSSGSGFRVVTTNANGERRFSSVTAFHVAAEDAHDQTNPRLYNVESVPAGSALKVGASEPFATEPSRYDRALDVISRATVAGPALEVATLEDAPRLGQKIEIAGHPYGFEGRYINSVCTFVGYGAAAPVAGFYVLDCPTGERPLGGCSGGPAVDAETGRVIGVMVEQGADPSGANPGDLKNTGLVFVSPLQRDASGQILFGPPATKTSIVCYELLSSKPQICTGAR